MRDRVESSSDGDYDEILSLDAIALSQHLEEGKVTAERLMEITLDQIDKVNPNLRALVLLRNREELLKEARLADSTPRKGWLHGIPTAVKDLYAAKGLPCTMGGSALYDESNVATKSDPHVQRLSDAGAIIISKTNSPEDGVGSHTFNSKFGTTVNPYDCSRSAGGSSGGAAVALATRMLCIVDGSDMMGSLRNPAGWNNIYSHRPSAGMLIIDDENRNDNDNLLLTYPISTVGPMARSPLDLAKLLETLSGEGKFDSSEVAATVKNFKIGWLGDWGGNYSTEEGILPLCRDALDKLASTGSISIDDITNDPPFPAEDLWKSWTTIRSKTISDNFVTDLGKDIFLKKGAAPIKAEALWEVKRGLEITENELNEAIELAGKWQRTASKMFERYDALALPSSQVWPFPADWRWPESINGKKMDTYHRWMEVTVPCSLAGLPCTTIPAGFGKQNGLPVGIQIFSDRGEDKKLLSLAQCYHVATGWPSKRPPALSDKVG